MVQPQFHSPCLALLTLAIDIRNHNFAYSMLILHPNSTRSLLHQTNTHSLHTLSPYNSKHAHSLHESHRHSSVLLCLSIFTSFSILYHPSKISLPNALEALFLHSTVPAPEHCILSHSSSYTSKQISYGISVRKQGVGRKADQRSYPTIPICSGCLLGLQSKVKRKGMGGSNRQLPVISRIPVCNIASACLGQSVYQLPASVSHNLNLSSGLLHLISAVWFASTHIEVSTRAYFIASTDVPLTNCHVCKAAWLTC